MTDKYTRCKSAVNIEQEVTLRMRALHLIHRWQKHASKSSGEPEDMVPIGLADLNAKHGVLIVVCLIVVCLAGTGPGRVGDDRDSDVGTGDCFHLLGHLCLFIPLVMHSIKP